MPRPIRVLHVIGGMNRGGVETWLLHLVRHADRSRLAMDFLVHTEQPCAYDGEVLASGAQIIRCMGHGRPLRYAKNLRRILRERGPYDVVHSHVHHFSGWVLAVAALAGVPVRIAHSHSDTRHLDSRASPARRAYLRATRALLRRSATAGFAASDRAGSALLGEGWRANERWSILRCGIDLTPFREPPRLATRRELGISPHAYVIGHVGRFVDIKNHAFLVSIAKAAAVLDSEVHFLLVGDGPLRADTERLVAEAGLSKRFTFAGERSDVPAFLTSAMDIFVLPSLWEGLPLVLIEAQAAGLRCLASDVVSPESGIVEGLFFQESLRSSAEVWAARLIELRSQRIAASRDSALRALEGSPFDVRANLQRLEACYSQRALK